MTKVQVWSKIRFLLACMNFSQLNLNSEKTFQNEKISHKKCLLKNCKIWHPWTHISIWQQLTEPSCVFFLDEASALQIAAVPTTPYYSQILKTRVVIATATQHEGIVVVCLFIGGLCFVLFVNITSWTLKSSVL